MQVCEPIVTLAIYMHQTSWYQANAFVRSKFMSRKNRTLPVAKENNFTYTDFYKFNNAFYFSRKSSSQEIIGIVLFVLITSMSSRIIYFSL